MPTRSRWFLAACIVTVLTSAVGAQSSQPASQPADLAQFIKAIHEAQTLSAAAAAYADGADLDRRNVALNTAYLRKLLQLGQPMATNTPALVLLSIPVEDGLAYGAAGYYYGRQNDLPKSLLNTIHAANLVKDDNSIQNDLGQLAAWYDCSKAYKLPAAEQQMLEKLKGDLAASAAYSAAYKNIQAGYTKLGEANAAIHQKIAAATADAKSAESKMQDAQKTLNSLNDDRVAAQKAKRDAERSMLRTGVTATERRRLQLEADKQAVAVDDINKKLERAQGDLQSAQNAFGQKRDAVAAAKLQSPPPVPLAKLFVWLPPAVDGVVTMPKDATPTTK